MTSPLPDPQQRDTFLDEAEKLGFNRDEFGFVFSTSLTKGMKLVHVLAIKRGELGREYAHGGGIQWLGQALLDLNNGVYGSPENQPSAVQGRG